MSKLNYPINKNQPNLCEPCCKKYISGLVDSGSENKKIARFLEHPLVVKNKVGVNIQSTPSNGDSVSDNLESDQISSKKRQRESTSPAKPSKRQKVKEKTESTKLLKCIN